MKKAVFSTLLLCVVFSFSACGDNTSPTASTSIVVKSITSSERTAPEASQAQTDAVEVFYIESVQAQQAAELARKTVFLDWVKLEGFHGVMDVPMHILMQTAATNTEPLSNQVWQYKLDENHLPLPQGSSEGDIIAAAKSLAVLAFIEDVPEVANLQEIPCENVWLAADVDETLCSTFGEWPEPDKSYIDYFYNDSQFYYVAEYGYIFYFNEPSAHKITPLILSMEEDGDKLYCDILMPTILHMNDYENEIISKENLLKEVPTYRYTFQYTDEGMIVIGIS